MDEDGDWSLTYNLEEIQMFKKELLTKSHLWIIVNVTENVIFKTEARMCVCVYSHY